MPFLPEAIWKRRLAAEFEELKGSGAEYTVNSDLTVYEFTIRAKGLVQDASGNVSSSNSHKVRVLLKREYPYAGGIEVTWLTSIFHPNIRMEDGRVCIHLLNEWAEGQSLSSLAAGLKQLLENPNPSDPLNKVAAEYFLAHPDALTSSTLSSSGPSASTRPRIVFSR